MINPIALRLEQKPVHDAEIAAISLGVPSEIAWLAIAIALAHRYVNRDEVSIELEPSRILVNTGGDPTFVELVQRVVHATKAQPLADLFRFVLQSRATQLLIRTQGAPGVTSRIALAVRRGPAEDGQVLVEYESAGLTSDDVVTLARHLGNVASHAGRDPQVRLSRIEMLDTLERERLLTMLTGPDVGYADAPVHELFERLAVERPHAVALRYGATTVSCAELNDRAERLAACLQMRGVNLEVPVGLCIERSPDMVAAVLAILKAGGAYVPLDVAYPAERLSNMIRHARPVIIVASKRTAHAVDRFGVDVLCVENIDEESSVRARPRVTLDNAAYFVYTSGSTGQPKAIVLTHRSILNGLNRVPFHRDNPREVSSLNSSIGVGFTTSRLYLPLLCGVPLVIFPDGEERDLRRLVASWEQAEVTNLAMVTPVLRQLLSLGPSFTSRLARVHTVGTGGDVMTPETMADFARAMPHAMLIHGYASSEVGGAAILHEWHGDMGNVKTSIGAAFPNTRIYVLDRWFNPVPIGASGEICVCALHLSRGYLHQPMLTAERFVPNPFAVDGSRLYRTGDIGCLSPDGELEVLGRLDDQVKIRGFRIDVREIEGALIACDEIAGAAVTSRDFSTGSRLVAYVLRAAGTSIGVSDVREFIARRLPEHMQPSLIVFVDSLPRTPTGKVDRQALPELTEDRPELDALYEPPRTRVEREVAGIWTEVLGIERIGVHDDFLEIGGDSLLATTIALRLQEQFGCELHEADLFERPTIANLSAYVQEIMVLGT